MKVLVSSFIGSITNIQIDGYVGSAVAVFIVIPGLLLVKDTLNLSRSSPTPELVKYTRQVIHMRILKNSTRWFMATAQGKSLQRSCRDSAEIDTIISHDIIDNIENGFKEELGIEIILH